MKFATIILFLSLVSTSCSNSQGVQLAKTDVYPSGQTSTERTKSSVRQANKIFANYTTGSPQQINLFLLDSAAQLQHNPSTELKTKPEGYLIAPSGGLSKTDSSLILKAYQKRLKGTTFLSLDALGNVLYYETGKRAPKHNYKETVSIIPVDSLKSRLKRLKSKYSPGQSYITEITHGEGANGKDAKSIKLTDSALDTSNTNIVYLKDLSKADILDYAMKDYELNNRVEDVHYRGFLWLNFFYKYFEVNESSELTVQPKWLLNFSVIDAANLELPDDFRIDPEKLVHLKDVFNKGEGYETGLVNTNGIRRHYLIIPRKDDVYTEKWKYITLDLVNEFGMESRTFTQMMMIVIFLKEKYENDVVKKLTTWYVDNGRGPLLITSFLKEEYDVKTNMNELNKEFLIWVEEKRHK